MSAEVATFPEPDRPQDEGEALVPEPIEPEHVLRLGDEKFVCAESMPLLTMVRYADGGMEQIHYIMVKLVDPDDLDRMWDAWESMPDFEAGMAAVSELIATYSDRPTERPAPSRRGSGSTRPN